MFRQIDPGDEPRMKTDGADEGNAEGEMRKAESKWNFNPDDLPPQRGRNILAQGNALGKKIQTIQALKERLSLFRNLPCK